MKISDYDLARKSKHVSINKKTWNSQKELKAMEAKLGYDGNAPSDGKFHPRRVYYSLSGQQLDIPEGQAEELLEAGVLYQERDPKEVEQEKKDLAMEEVLQQAKALEEAQTAVNLEEAKVKRLQEQLTRLENSFS